MTDTTEAPLTTRFLLFLGPLVLTHMLQALSGTFSRIYLGQMLGAEAMAAAVIFVPVFMFLIAFVIGLGTGASILIGQARGAHNLQRARQVAGSVLWGGLWAGVAVAALGLVLARPLLLALGTPAPIMGDALVYARILMVGMPVFFVSLLASAVLRGMGDTVTPLRMLVVACIGIGVLTPALIRGWLGLPAMGVASAAWANVAATLLGLLWLVWRLEHQHDAMALRALRGCFRWDGKLWATVLRLGIPTGLFTAIGALADMALLALVSRHGVQATAAWGAVNQVVAYVLFTAISISIASSVFAAQAIGAGRTEDVQRVTRVGLLMNLWLTGGLALGVALLAPQVSALFVQDAGVIELSAQVLRLCIWGAVIFGLASVFSGVMRAAGTVRVPTLISLGCLSLLLFPLGWVLGRSFGLPYVWLAYPATYGCALVMQAAYFHAVWKRRPIVRMV